MTECRWNKQNELSVSFEFTLIFVQDLTWKRLLHPNSQKKLGEQHKDLGDIHTCLISVWPPIPPLNALSRAPRHKRLCYGQFTVTIRPSQWFNGQAKGSAICMYGHLFSAIVKSVGPFSFLYWNVCWDKYCLIGFIDGLYITCLFCLIKACLQTRRWTRISSTWAPHVVTRYSATQKD